MFTAYLCEAHLRAGALGEAHQFAERVLALSRKRCERGIEALALYLVGEIAALSGDRPEPSGARHYNAALALASDLGVLPLVAHCLLGLGKLYRRAGESVKAEEHLQTATTMYREMGMTFWLEQAEAASVAGES
jgi:hypothetical protein